MRCSTSRILSCTWNSHCPLHFSANILQTSKSYRYLLQNRNSNYILKKCDSFKIKIWTQNQKNFQSNLITNANEAQKTSKFYKNYAPLIPMILSNHTIHKSDKWGNLIIAILFVIFFTWWWQMKLNTFTCYQSLS